MNRVTNITCRTMSGARLGGFAYRYDALDYHVYDDDWQVIADLDESGNVVARWTYDAWGNVLTEEIADSAVELRTVRYRFQGREWSAATGLTNFRMRWYDAVTGRWLSKDPIRLNGGLNLYAFCNSNPGDIRDPIGLARLGVRGLKNVNTTFTLAMTGLLIPITGQLIDSNLGPFHKHIFFEDGKEDSNVGFFPKGICKDDDDKLDSYHYFGPHYDDDKLREAVRRIQKSGMWKPEGAGIGGYDVISHNCQDFVDAVIRMYEKL